MQFIWPSARWGREFDNLMHLCSNTKHFGCFEFVRESELRMLMCRHLLTWPYDAYGRRQQLVAHLFQYEYFFCCCCRYFYLILKQVHHYIISKMSTTRTRSCTLHIVNSMANILFLFLHFYHIFRIVIVLQLFSIAASRFFKPFVNAQPNWVQLPHPNKIIDTTKPTP